MSGALPFGTLVSLSLPGRNSGAQGSRGDTTKPSLVGIAQSYLEFNNAVYLNRSLYLGDDQPNTEYKADIYID